MAAVTRTLMDAADYIYTTVTRCTLGRTCCGYHRCMRIRGMTRIKTGIVCCVTGGTRTAVRAVCLVRRYKRTGT